MRTNLVKWILAAAMSIIAAKANFAQRTGTGYRKGSKAPKYPKHKPAGNKLARHAAMHRFGTMRGQVVTLEGKLA